MIPALTFAIYAIALDGKPVLPRVRAAVVDGRVLLPVRELGNALGADVEYDARTHRIVIRQGARVAELSARGAVRIAGGRAYAPLRAAARAFGFDVTYLSASRTVALTSSGARTVARTTLEPRPRDATLPATDPPRAAQPAFTTSPPDGARIHDPYPSISARFAGANAIDRRSLRVILDGRDVSADAALIGDQVLLTPRTALQSGSHDVGITAQTADGVQLSALWQFIDTFAFSNAPPPTPYPVNAIFIDRSITPGTNVFDVIVQGAPGITGFVGIDGVGIFPLQVYADNGYVAHVVIPYGVFQPYARVVARLNLPDGTSQTIVLPQRVPIVTVTPTPVPQPAPTAQPRRRSVDVPTPAPATRAPLPHARASAPPTVAPTPEPTAMPTASPSPVPTMRPRRRAPLAKPRPTPLPAASPPA